MGTRHAPTQTPSRSPGRAFLSAPASDAHVGLTPSTSRALAAASLPTAPFASDADLRARLQTGRSALIAAERLLISSKADRRRAHDAELAQLQEEGRRLDKERAKLEQQARLIQAQLDGERRDVEEAQRTIRALETRRSNMANQLTALDADETELGDEAAARQTAWAAQRERLEQQAAQNAPELAFLSEQLGMTIKSRAFDRVLFTFNRVDPSAPKRTYSFEIDVSKQDYAVHACSPPLPQLESLVQELNLSRDFMAFVVTVRRLFVDSLGGR